MIRIWHYWIPGALCSLGILLVVLGGGTADAAVDGAPVFSAGAFIWLGGIFYRMSQSSRLDRDDETSARAFFTEHGHWPDEPPKPGAPRQAP